MANLARRDRSLVARGGIRLSSRSFVPFSINSGFVAGLNTLDFVVEDVGVISGFRVAEISGTASPVPEPLTILGSATALGFGALLKRQHSQKQKKDKQSA